METHPLLFIVYDNVVTSQEAVTNESIASELLGWISGSVFKDLVTPRTIKKDVRPEFLADARQLLLEESSSKAISSENLNTPEGLSEFYRRAGDDSRFDLNMLLNRINSLLIYGLKSVDDCDLAVSPDVSAFWEASGCTATELQECLAVPKGLRDREKVFRVVAGFPQSPRFSIRSFFSADEWRLFVQLNNVIEGDMIPDLLTARLPFEEYLETVKRRQDRARERGIRLQSGEFLERQVASQLLGVDERPEVKARAQAFRDNLLVRRELFTDYRRDFFALCAQDGAEELKKIVEEYRGKIDTQAQRSEYTFIYEDAELAIGPILGGLGEMVDGDQRTPSDALLEYAKKHRILSDEVRERLRTRRIAEAVVQITQ